MCKRLLLITLVLTMTACAFGPPRIVAKTTMPAPSAQDMTDCPELALPTSGRAGDLLANHVETAKAYHECRARQAGLADYIRRVRQALNAEKD